MCAFLNSADGETEEKGGGSPPETGACLSRTLVPLRKSVLSILTSEWTILNKKKRKGTCSPLEFPWWRRGWGEAPLEPVPAFDAPRVPLSERLVSMGELQWPIRAKKRKGFAVSGFPARVQAKALPWRADLHRC